MDPLVGVGPEESDVSETQPAKQSLENKRQALAGKCQALLDRLTDFQADYSAILEALEKGNRDSIAQVRDELHRLKSQIGRLEKKTIKRFRLAGTLTNLSKDGQRLKLKPALGRRKDIQKLDEYLAGALRSLVALNEKLSRKSN
ncbi:MAG: hypothetical protein AB1898_20410 [Acidobacteriota bacterium]